jgi:hypothetical protein
MMDNGEQKTSTYVVQRAVVAEVSERDGVLSVEFSSNDEAPCPPYIWEDLGVVTVPVRTQRKTVIAMALERFKVPENSHPSVFRALSEDAVEEIRVRMERPPSPPIPEPELRIG